MQITQITQIIQIIHTREAQDVNPYKEMQPHTTVPVEYRGKRDSSLGLCAVPAEQVLSPKQTVVEEFSRLAEQKRLLEQQQQRLRDQWQAMAYAQEQAGIHSEDYDHEDTGLSSSASQGQFSGKISILVLGLSLMLFIGLRTGQSISVV